MDFTSTPRNRDLLVASRQVAGALGFTAADVTELAVSMGGEGRGGWSTAELLLVALAELTRRDPGRRDLVGAAEAGDILGVTGGDLHRLAERPGFPEPRYVLAAGKLWARSDIVAFNARKDRRPGSA
ncbi:hypothetical protein [Sphaerisporangium sp. TRM90804]|uniref:hypothetical protein n=1 Tax=Sphaerisporangium sp. TRM90804 TaxID=3031113 RepID=UPI00244AD547|nr:hypothetical protein [Sphaerisporangium sp. TRM90804]MDH2429538.1 hypothetical protein [Sphaerisporangium sp. TRM90804]